MSKENNNIVTDSFSSKNMYLHKESNPDKVYLSPESPELKQWCKKEKEKLLKRKF